MLDRNSNSLGRTRHESPLAYLLALEGISLLRAFTGEHDGEFTARRVAEVRDLIERYGSAPVIEVSTVDPDVGYRHWARTYDSGENPAFADEPVLERLLHDVGPTDVLDAACGTGRHSRWLAALGHRVTGVDGSLEMLELARRDLPEATFLQGDLTGLPLPDEAVGAAVCALALTHVPDLEPALRELARVVRRGGRVLIADVHPDSVALGSAPAVRTDAGRPARIATYRHSVGDYVRSALAAGLVVSDLIELPGAGADSSAAAAEDLGPWDVWPWSLRSVVPEAAAAASSGVPSLLVIGLSRPPTSPGHGS